MDQSLSIVVAVHNAQDSLDNRVADLLEVAPELTPDFEILIVDDGSTDDTEEIAHELAIQYPQVRLLRHDRQRGIQASIRDGLAVTDGDVVFVHDNGGPISSADVRRLWSLRGDRDLVMASAEASSEPLESDLVERLMAWGAEVRAAGEMNHGELRMIRREALGDADELDAIEGPALEGARSELHDGIRKQVRSPKYMVRPIPGAVLNPMPAGPDPQVPSDQGLT